MTQLSHMLRETSAGKRAEFVAAYIGEDPERFAGLVRIFCGEDNRQTQRASGPLMQLVKKKPQLLKPHLTRLIGELERSGNRALIRNILRVLQFTAIPQKETGRVMNLCFDKVMDPKEPVANRAFSLGVLAVLAEPYPGISAEIRLSIESQWPHASPGFRARAKKVLKQLDKQKKA